MARVLIDGAGHTYPGAMTPAVDELTLEVADGELVVLVGPSGSGKTTILRMLAGLAVVSPGRILIGERDVTQLAPKERDIAMVFQNYALYPQMTVAQNMGFALRMARVKPEEIARRVSEAARLLDLEPYLGRRPKALSGGQRQRVAMGRAIVREPQVFLMDEPLSNLDAQLRVQTRAQIAELQRRLAVTTVYVTHDQVEAMTLGDRVVVLKDGRVQQVDTPTRLYEEPCNAFVAGFIGSPAMNLLALELSGEGAELGGVTFPLERAIRDQLAEQGARTVQVGVRPEDLCLEEPGRGVPVRVEAVEALGAECYVYGKISLPDRSERQLILRTQGRGAPARGSIVHVNIPPGRLHAFDVTTGNRVGDIRAKPEPRTRPGEYLLERPDASSPTQATFEEPSRLPDRL
jgi:multiple sugar transport system ATP-binding protein